MTALLGILGGGQLGRMMALSAAKLGVSCSIFAPEDAPCAAQIAPHVQASYEDEKALAQWANKCQVITFEFENIATNCLSVCADKLSLCQSSA
jgi:Phosphoribosylaminoimidazole carboxylase (NCAIR synthetase)